MRVVSRTSPSTILVVTEAGRNNVEDSGGQVLDLMKSNEVDLILAGVVTRKYTLLSGDGVHGNARTAGTRESRHHQQVKQ